MKKINYQSPKVEVIRVNIEKGFAQSPGVQINSFANPGEPGMLQEGETLNM